jgi:hypothetical protein
MHSVGLDPPPADARLASSTLSVSSGVSSRDEVRAALANKTMYGKTTKVYFSPEGVVFSLGWGAPSSDKTLHKGLWSVRTDGKVCLQAPGQRSQECQAIVISRSKLSYVVSDLVLSEGKSNEFREQFSFLLFEGDPFGLSRMQ